MTAASVGLLLGPQQLHTRLGTPGLVLLDATVDLRAPRVDGDYRVHSGCATSRLPGALHADLLGELSNPHASYSFAMPRPAAFARQLQGLGVGPGSQIVLYDRADGFWAARLWWMLRSVGISACLLDGGWRGWQQAGLPLESGAVTPAPAAAPPRVQPRPGCWASLAQVRAISLGQAPGRLVCALGAGVFDGSAVTRYARRGHIPGSLNRPARLLYDADGKYLPVAALRSVLGEDLVNDPTPLVLYCGGGISAAATAVALTLAGREQLALYDGSLQQWSADPALPMTTGAAPA